MSFKGVPMTDKRRIKYKKVKKWLLDNDRTMKSIAAELELDESTLSNWASGRYGSKRLDAYFENLIGKKL